MTDPVTLAGYLSFIENRIIEFCNGVLNYCKAELIMILSAGNRLDLIQRLRFYFGFWFGLSG